MAKRKIAGGDPNELVAVKVYRSISVDGVAHRPIVDRDKITPTEAVIRRERAIAHGGDVEIVGPAASRKQGATPADKQVTVAADKGG